MPEKDEIEIWVAEQVEASSTASGLHALPGDSSEASGLTVLRRVSVKQAQIKQKIAEMGSFVTGLLDGWAHDRVRLDEVDFSLEVSSEGAVRWVLGAGIKGTASIKFKIDPAKPSQVGHAQG